MKLHEKLKVIRVKLLNITQSKLARAVGSKQKDISLLENARKEFIPNRYLEYLAKEGIDLNSLFHPRKKVCFLSSEQESGCSSERQRHDPLKEKVSNASDLSDKITPQKAMETLYEMRDLLNKVLK